MIQSVIKTYSNGEEKEAKIEGEPYAPFGTQYKTVRSTQMDSTQYSNACILLYPTQTSKLTLKHCSFQQETR